MCTFLANPKAWLHIFEKYKRSDYAFDGYLDGYGPG